MICDKPPPVQHEITMLDYLTVFYGNCDPAKGGEIVFTHKNKVAAHCSLQNGLVLAATLAQRHLQDLFLKINLMDYKRTVARNPHGVGNNDEVLAIVGFHLDVDAGKDDRYLTRDRMLEALEAMPLKPSIIVNTNGVDGGFHPYWLLDTPHYITDQADRERCQAISNRWLEELRQHAKPGTIDGTADLCRVLRPVGSIRKNGKVVSPYSWNPERRYTLEQFELPPLKLANTNPAAAPANTATHDPATPGGLASTALRRPPKSAIPDLRKRARAYIEKIPGAVAGKKGHDQTLEAAGSLFRLALDDESAWQILTEYNQRCEPPWTIRELEHKAEAAKRKVIDNGEWGNKLSEEDWIDKQEKAEDGPPTVRAGSVLTKYLQDLSEGNVPRLIQQSTALNGIEIGGGMITGIGAGPGAGKTALCMQIVFDALRLDKKLTAVIANAEMGFEVLLRRELTRLTDIRSDKIRFADLDKCDLERIQRAGSHLMEHLERVQVLVDPHDLGQLLRLLECSPGILVVDYLQKFAPRDLDPRLGVGAVMAGLRQLARRGWYVIAISATSRPQKGDKKLTMSSLRESSEIEFNCDSIYLLNDNGPVNNCENLRSVTLDCAKNRHGAPRDIELVFNRPKLEFTSPVVVAYPEFGEVVDVEDNPFCFSGGTSWTEAD